MKDEQVNKYVDEHMVTERITEIEREPIMVTKEILDEFPHMVPVVLGESNGNGRISLRVFNNEYVCEVLNPNNGVIYLAQAPQFDDAVIMAVAAAFRDIVRAKGIQ